MKEDARVAVAITGSAARGDASAGSDLDLWCISPKCKEHQRARGTFRGTDVTLLCDGPRSARAERTFLRCEVDDLVVLRDPRGDFRAVQAQGRRQAKQTWAALCRNTSVDLVAELTEATRGPAWNRISPLRESALRFGAAWVYQRRGWRTPRWRTLQSTLPSAAVRSLRRVLSLPPAVEARGALAQLQKVRALPDEVLARMKAEEWEEAVLLARRDLERDVLARKGAGRWKRVSPALVRAVTRLHGAPTDADVEHVFAEVDSLARRLEVLPWFSPAVGAALDAR